VETKNVTINVSKEVATCAPCVYLSKINQNKRRAQKTSTKVEKKKKESKKEKAGDK